MTDNLVFESLPAPERSIERHYLVGKLQGLKPTAPSKASVLEIGCGTGFTLIAQAVRFPESRFVGLDISEELLSHGIALADTLALKNIEFRVGDVQKFLPSREQFDYVICHGLFSWVDRQCQAQILKICRETLSKSGIAYISFNCLPGWYHRGQIRQSLRQVYEPSSSATENVKVARKILKEMSEEYISNDDTLGQAIKSEAIQCLKQSDAFIFHELLAEHNQGFFVNQFAEMLKENELQYLGDGFVPRMRAWRFEEETQVKKPDVSIESNIEREQWLDYIKPVSFRGALATNAKATISDEWKDSVLQASYIASPLVARTDPPDVHSDAVEVFVGPREETVEVNDQVMKSCLLILQRNWPQSITFYELADLSLEMATGKKPKPIDRTELAQNLLPYFLCGLVEVFVESLPCRNKVAEKPRVTNLTKALSTLRTWTISPKHEYVPFGPFEQALIPALDGTKDRDALIHFIEEKIKAGDLGIQESESLSYEEKRQAISDQLDQSLFLLCEHGLLV